MDCICNYCIDIEFLYFQKCDFFTAYSEDTFKDVNARAKCAFANLTI